MDINIEVYFEENKDNREKKVEVMNTLLTTGNIYKYHPWIYHCIAVMIHWPSLENLNYEILPILLEMFGHFRRRKKYFRPLFEKWPSLNPDKKEIVEQLLVKYYL